MTKQTINIGSIPGDGAGDPLRVSFDKINQNFAELYTTVYSLPTSAPATSIGKAGDKLGMTFINADYVYVCIGNYDGEALIWKRSPLTGVTF